MSAHRWIKRRDGRVELWSGDVHLGALRPTGMGWLVVLPEWARRVWIGNGATNPPRMSSGHEAKSAAKRALLRAVLPPKTRGREAEATVGSRWVGSQFMGDDVVLGYTEPSLSIEGGTLARVLGHGKYLVAQAHFPAESEARWWVEARSKGGG